MVYFETANGGAVFSVGSIAYCGSLSADNYNSSASRVTENVLRRFLSPEPLLQGGAPGAGAYQRAGVGSDL
jgi:N,N-dimethylformamidase